MLNLGDGLLHFGDDEKLADFGHWVVDIGQAVNGFGGAVIMTSKKPRNGTERVAEAARGLKSDIIVNIQADNIGPIGPVMDRVIKAMNRVHKESSQSGAYPIYYNQVIYNSLNNQ